MTKRELLILELIKLFEVVRNGCWAIMGLEQRIVKDIVESRQGVNIMVNCFYFSISFRISSF